LIPTQDIPKRINIGGIYDKIYIFTNVNLERNKNTYFCLILLSFLNVLTYRSVLYKYIIFHVHVYDTRCTFLLNYWMHVYNYA
jgi:hypothetical protein